MSVPFIEFKNVIKTFRQQDKEFPVLKGIDLSIEEGDIFGIIGFSGAGKSTLIRCVNRLEKIDGGSIRVGNYDIENLSPPELNLYKQKIGIIFQQFNLLDSRTVFKNVSFPLEIVNKSKKEIKERVLELLELVDIVDKKDFYPGQLSGGQKQRVGIARALVNNPFVLLSDEATSALDPVSSLAVLDLLKNINKKLGLTIVLITHELDVVKYACNNVAILEEGKIVEKGKVRDIFLNPKSKTANLFININENFLRNDWADKGEGI
ncbi:MAG: ATP-binding cassette domain-containing protein [Elusimicrobiota bacterium]|jgi:D-methionine transport system ATP-binding protein|nr:ATP-binding cassette domain-containing protein [Elusimicrobiota bacterium]